MKKHLIMSLLTLAGTVFPGTTTLAQSTFVYGKGRSFKDINACQIPEPLRIDGTSALIMYAGTVPNNQSILCHNIQLPVYIRGVFFSRDSRPGDFEWPNNTNRLLPWMLGRLKGLTQENYSGIPSNARPLTLGGALLLQPTDGSCLFVKIPSGDNSLSWFQINKDGSLNLYVSTFGCDRLSGKMSVVLVQNVGSTYQVLRQAYETLIADHKISAPQKRMSKEYFEALSYLRWCTWEHYHYDISETKIPNDLDAIEASGIPVRYVLIDDGHIANR